MSSSNVTIQELGAPTALKAFYGAGNAKREAQQLDLSERPTSPAEGSLKAKAAARRANTAKAHIGTGERPQEIYTPAVIIEAILKVWPYIALDPCSGPDSTVGAIDNYYLPPSVTLTKSGRQKIKYLPVGADLVDGLIAPWRDYSYVNPPYAELKSWLMKARIEGQDNEHEVMMLVPARGHRAWFRDVVATCSEVCDLNPVRFNGYKSTFPAPLVMLYWGQSRSLFREAFSGKIGDCR